MLDEAELERAYLAHSRAVHPDFHLNGSSADLETSLELSAEVNEAYNTLRDPFARADYLLGLEGGPTATDHRELPEGFLMEMLDLREQIEVRRASAIESGRLKSEFTERYRRLLDEIANLFVSYESATGTASERSNLLRQIRTALNAARYVRGLMRDLNPN